MDIERSHKIWYHYYQVFYQCSVNGAQRIIRGNSRISFTFQNYDGDSKGYIAAQGNSPNDIFYSLDDTVLDNVACTFICQIAGVIFTDMGWF